MTLRLTFVMLTVLSVALVHCHPYHARDNPDASQRLLQSNALWSANVTRAYPDFFANSAKGQDPKARTQDFWFSPF